MKKGIKVLYISSLCSSDVFSELFELSVVKPRVAAQRFNGLLAEGIVQNEKIAGLETFSAVPTTYRQCKKRFLFFGKRNQNDIVYRHIPCVNVFLLKELLMVFWVFFGTIAWIFRNRGYEKTIVCDILNFSISIGALTAAKLFGAIIVAVVTDIPALMLSSTKPSLRQRIYNSLSGKIINQYDLYVLLTKQMNDLINKKKKPYIIIEGLVDSKQGNLQNRLDFKWPGRNVVYAGGIYRGYGIDMLLEAFGKIADQHCHLIFYGEGDMIAFIEELSKKDKRIEYRGIVPNNEVLLAQLAASVLVNPRPSSLGLSAYSFPSKNLEYMASGTPVLTTKLKGIPSEYFSYVYPIEIESAEGMYAALDGVFSKSPEELHKFGLAAQSFVLREKNQLLQADKLISFIARNSN